MRQRPQQAERFLRGMDDEPRRLFALEQDLTSCGFDEDCDGILERAEFGRVGTDGGESHVQADVWRWGVSAGATESQRATRLLQL